MEMKENDKEVTIRGIANVEGGTTCAPCVEKMHSKCNVSDCLCARHNHVVN